MDWTPMNLYGIGVNVPALTTVHVVLYPVPDYSGDNEFLFEDSEEQGLFLRRIVGSVFMAYDQEPTVRTQWGWRLQPFGVDYSAGTVLEPFNTPWDNLDSDWANLRWWDERQYVPTTQLFPVAVDHPYWTKVDISPRQMMGAKRNLWPCLSVRNSNSGFEGRLFHTLRALWS